MRNDSLQVVFLQSLFNGLCFLLTHGSVECLFPYFGLTGIYLYTNHCSQNPSFVNLLLSSFRLCRSYLNPLLTLSKLNMIFLYLMVCLLIEMLKTTSCLCPCVSFLFVNERRELNTNIEVVSFLYGG